MASAVTEHYACSGGIWAVGPPPQGREAWSAGSAAAVVCSCNQEGEGACQGARNGPLEWGASERLLLFNTGGMSLVAYPWLG